MGKDIVMSFVDEINKERNSIQQQEKNMNNPIFKINKLNSECKKGIEVTMDELLFKVYKNSLPLDDDYVDANEELLRNELRSYTNSKGGSIEYMKEGIVKTKSPLLKKMLESVENIVNEDTRKKHEKITELSYEDLNFKITPEIDEKLDSLYSDMEFDEIQDSIKQNVTNTVMEEIEKSKKEKEEQEEFENSLRENEDISTEAALENAIRNNKTIRGKTYQPSLFESVMMYNLKRYGEDADMDIILGESVKEYTKLSISKALKLENFNYKDVVALSNKYANM